jgi:hypothetical protein
MFNFDEIDDDTLAILELYRLSTPEEKKHALKMLECFMWINEAAKIADERQIMLWDIC